MSILSSLAGAAGMPHGATKLLPVLLEELQKYPGGIAGLIAKFQSEGLGAIVASWIGTGTNEPISEAQVKTVLGQETVSNIVQTAGSDEPAVLRTLTDLLPLVVDKLSPDGVLKDEKLDPGELMGMLSKLISRFQ